MVSAATSPPPPAYGVSTPPYTAAMPVPGPVGWGEPKSRLRANRRFFLPSALTAAAVAIAVVLVVAFGPGKSGSTLTNTQMLALVHNASNGLARSPATTFTMTMTISGAGQHQTIDMTGVTSNANRTASFTMTGPGVDESMRVVDGVVYVQLPASAVAMNDGKPWVGVPSVTPTAQEQQLESSGPAGLLQSLANVGGTVQDKGTQTVDGVQTTEYSVHIDVSKVLSTENPQLASSLDVGSLPLNDVPMTIWLDRQGLPRKLTMQLSLNGVSVDEVATMTPSNAVPHVSAPPASEVRVFNSLSDFETSMARMYGGASPPSY